MDTINTIAIIKTKSLQNNKLCSKGLGFTEEGKKKQQQQKQNVERIQHAPRFDDFFYTIN